MSRYLLDRLLQMGVVLFLVSILAFSLIHLVPGSPARVKLGNRATPEAVERLEHQLGVDRPLPEQYWDFISGAVTLDFGRSLDTDEDVGTVIGRRAEPSLLLVGYSLVLMVLLAVPLAMIAAVRRRSWLDKALQTLPTISLAMPSFWLALLLVQVFSLQLRLLPTSGYGDTLPRHLESLTLPAIVLALGLFPVLLRLLRASMIETMQSEYIEAARARGLSEIRVMVKHVLRVSALPAMTFIGLIAGLMLGLTVVVEQVFSIPGLGSLLVSAVGTRDFPTVSALVLLFGAAVLVASLLTDLAYALLDPRVRL